MDAAAPISERKDSFFPVFEQSGVHKAALFGSYAAGQANTLRDTDLPADDGLRGLTFWGL